MAYLRLRDGPKPLQMSSMLFDDPSVQCRGVVAVGTGGLPRVAPAHLGHETMPEDTLAAAHRWAAEIAGPAYAIDDQTAIKVTNGAVEVVSEGHWKLLPD